MKKIFAFFKSIGLSNGGETTNNLHHETTNNLHHETTNNLHHETTNNLHVKDIFEIVTSYLNHPADLAKTDILCQTIKYNNEQYWVKYVKQYFGQDVKVGNAREAYFQQVMNKNYYVVTDIIDSTDSYGRYTKDYIYKLNYQRLALFPDSPLITIYKDFALAKVKWKENQKYTKGYCEPKCFIFAVKLNQKNCLSKEIVEVSRDHIDAKSRVFLG